MSRFAFNKHAFYFDKNLGFMAMIMLIFSMVVLSATFMQRNYNTR